MHRAELTILLSLMVIFHYVQSHSLKCNAPIRLAQGFVQGEELESTNGGKFCSFRGLPYGKAPVAELRFQPPQPAESWEGSLNATKDAPMCAQLDFFTGTINDNEDCLTLNVYTPWIPQTYGHRRYGSRKGRLPVLVFIHGGGFSFGDGSMKTYAPHRIMEKNVVLVVIQYRLGPFGFLSTADSAASGNYGLLDQRLALKWTQDNIDNFGGDPRRVTIFGESAGSASVMYQVISHGSKGLFSGAIAESGTVLNHWSLQKSPLIYANLLGQALQCSSGSDNSALVECLRTRPAKNIIGAMIALKLADSLVAAFVPVVEGPAYGRFLTEDPLELLERGNVNDVPLIIGTTRDEVAFMFAATLGSFNPAIFNTIDDNFFNVLLPQFIAKMARRQTNLVNISYAIKREYFDKIDVNNRADVMRTVIAMTTDLTFKAGTSLTARLLSNRGKRVYLYSFEHAGNVSQTNFTGEKDVKHADDLPYLFNMGVLTEGDQKFSRELIDIWTKFGLFGNPTPFGKWWGLRWPTTGSGEKLRYLKFGESTNTVEVQSDLRIERDDFWNELVPFTVDPTV